MKSKKSKPKQAVNKSRGKLTRRVADVRWVQCERCNLRGPDCAFDYVGHSRYICPDRCLHQTYDWDCYAKLMKERDEMVNRAHYANTVLNAVRSKWVDEVLKEVRTVREVVETHLGVSWS